jgi:hypothetical protein
MFCCTINDAPETQEPVLATISGKIRNIIDETTGSERRTGWDSQMMQYGKQILHNRSSSAHSNESEPDRKSRAAYVQIDIDHISDDSGSISDDGEDKGESSFKRRTRVSNRIRSPSFKRKGNNFSPFANIGKSSAEKAARSTFLPTSYGSDDKMYSTFICPRCKTRQREFFTVDNVGRLESPGSYLAVYFAVEDEDDGCCRCRLAHCIPLVP